MKIVTEEQDYTVYLTMKEVEKEFWGTLFTEFTEAIL
ncbi:hypothetical protein ACFOKG_04450 [Pedobacter jamesrossensis]